MDPLTISFWVIAGIATMMIATSVSLLAKLKSLHKNRSCKELEKETQISDLHSRLTSLQSDLAKTKKELTRAQGEINDLKDIETQENTELQQLKKILEAISKERDRLDHETAVNQESISRQQKDLEQAISERSQLRKTLREKEQQIKKLEGANQGMSEKIEQLESGIAELCQEKEVNQETIFHQQEELKQASSQQAELQDNLKQKEQAIQKLQETNLIINRKSKEAQDEIQGLKKEIQAQAVIIRELKKEYQIKKAQGEETAPAVEDENELEQDRERKNAKLVDVLLKNKLISKAALEKALPLQEKYGGSLLQFLFVAREVNENQLVECISDKFAVPYLPLGTYDISGEIAELVPITLAEKYWILPVDKVENDLMLVMVDPFDNIAIREIEQSTGCKVKVYIGLLSEIAKKIQRLYKVNIRGLDAEGNLISPLFIKTNEYKGRERRRAVRFKARLDLKVTHDNQVAISTTQDICWDGFSFKLDHEIPVYSTVTIQLSLPEPEDGKTQLPIAALAQVRRCDSLENNVFIIGAQFLKISKEDIASIIKYASDNQNNKPAEVSEKPNIFSEPPEKMANNLVETK